MANTFRSSTYRSAITRSYLSIGFLAAITAIDILFAIGCVIELVSQGAQFEVGDGASIPLGLTVIGLGSLVYFPVYLGTIIFFLIWLFRAYNNLSPLKARNLEFSPGWAIGWWFVPFANLVKPFQVVRELWNESDPDFDEDIGFMSSSYGTPEIIGFWWAAFIVSGIVFRISDRMIDSDGNVTALFPAFFLVASIVNAAAGILAILIVRRITERQEKRIEKVEGEENQLPPPPTFN